MRYPWNVVSEVLRLMPPVRGAFREALTDFTYAGYRIPKGWKLKEMNMLARPQRLVFLHHIVKRFKCDLLIPDEKVPYDPNACPMHPKVFQERLFPDPQLPPGSLGWPLLGETLQFLPTRRTPKPERFVSDRMKKYNPQVFKTSLFGETVAVFCGPAGNKFLFHNENKLVNLWWPTSVKKLMKSSLSNVVGDDAKRMRKMLLTSLDRDALKRYIDRMDLVAQNHIRTHWEGKEELKLHPTINLYTFELSCRLFASIDDPTHISKLAHHFDIFLKGVIHFPIYVPGTPFYRASKAADAIKEELRLIARKRREALDKKMESHRKDLLSHLLVTTDASGKLLSESEIVDNMLMLLFASHDTTTSAMTCVMKYLAELPEVYQMVLREQLDIAKSKEAGELLKWEDIQRMRYSWRVVSEVLRMIPPIRGTFRKALVDFTYAGYKIPKGWKLYWSPDSTTKDPAYFPNPEEFHLETNFDIANDFGCKTVLVSQASTIQCWLLCSCMCICKYY
ncbi:PREDICTED: beta-amyrin 28-oxidase-like [Populus euphratica]|uniref:Beta-amyrin 28-oxidase-like n=1 Tax=Populus euphratica TaxID=75702 RepID=A0AAJ6VGZ8_POPEU|nr:PREDICTED: beta-amyrin 28-oxidase-like [Populus euphratica]